MRERVAGIDRFLISLAILAPLAMVMLTKWQASLNIWYMTQDSAPLSQSLEADVAAWIAAEGLSSAKLVLIVDRNCPCTNATIAQLKKGSTSRNINPTVLDLEQVAASPLGANLVKALPATPTLFAVREGNIVYIGPVAGGDFCTKQVEEILALTILDRGANEAYVNTFSKGCYCPTADRED